MYREAPGTPAAMPGFQHTGAFGVAGGATAAVGQVPFGNFIPVPANKLAATPVAPGTAACLIVNIPGVGIANAVFHGDAACPGQGGRR